VTAPPPDDEEIADAQREDDDPPCPLSVAAEVWASWLRRYGRRE
jgi:hypothetical protein